MVRRRGRGRGTSVAISPTQTAIGVWLRGQAVGRGSSHKTPAEISASHRRLWRDDRAGTSQRTSGGEGDRPRNGHGDQRPARLAAGDVSEDKWHKEGRARLAATGKATRRDVRGDQHPAQTAVGGHHRGQAAKGGKRDPRRRGVATTGLSAPLTAVGGAWSRMSGGEGGVRPVSADKAAGRPWRLAQCRWPWVYVCVNGPIA